MRRWTLAKILRAPRGLVERPAMLGLLLTMSLPAIMSQPSATAMSYIDAAMVGSLGAAASASVGLVEATTWLAGGLTVSAGVGFSIQAAQSIGARDLRQARAIFHQALIACSVFAALLVMGALAIVLYMLAPAIICLRGIIMYWRLIRRTRPAALARATTAS